MNPTGILKSMLATSAEASALCGSRIFPVTIPQNAALPAIRVATVSVAPNDTKTGMSEVDNLYVQIDCYAAEYADAAKLAVAVRSRIDKRIEEVTVTGAGGVSKTWSLQGVKFLSRDDSYEETSRVFRVMQNFIFRVPLYPQAAVIAAGSTITAGGSISALIYVIRQPASILSASASISATANKARNAAATLSASAAIAADARPGALAVATLNASATMVVRANKVQKAASTMNAGASVSVAANFVLKGAATATASATINATGVASQLHIREAVATLNAAATATPDVGIGAKAIGSTFTIG